MQTFTDIYRYRFVLTNLVSKNLKVMYRNMALGLLWTLLNPIVMITTLTVVWVVVFKAQMEFAAMCIVGLIPYNFTAYCLTGCTAAIPANTALVKKSSFPRQVLPVSIVLTHLIHFGIQSILMVVLLLTFPLEWGAGSSVINLLWIVPVFLVHLGLCVGVGMLVAALNAIYRDVQYIVESLLTVLFWLCPVIYSDARLPHPDPFPFGLGLLHTNPLYFAYYLNPLSGVITAYRDVLFHGKAPDLVPFGLAIFGTLVIGYLGVRTFWKHEREFADVV